MEMKIEKIHTWEKVNKDQKHQPKSVDEIDIDFIKNTSPAALAEMVKERRNRR